ncbi:hypothetical protein KFE98_16010 [bacterium SCSIO 12741]|nr:hypothetical protein KFE98_16010 [bacterium SCSIO 12741]
MGPLNDWMVWLSWASPISLLLGILSAIRWGFRLDDQNRVVLVFLILFLIIDQCSRFIEQWFSMLNNLHFLSWSAWIEFAFFSILYTRFFVTRKFGYLKWVLSGIGILLLVHLLSRSFYVELEQFQLYDRLLVDGVVMLLGLLYLFVVLDSRKMVERAEQVTNIFILFYAAVDLFMSLTVNFMVNAGLSFVFVFWLIRLVFLVALYINLAQGIWHNGRSLKHR